MEVVPVNSVLTCALDNSVALYAVLLVEPAPQLGVQVGTLIVDGIVVGVQPLTLFNGHLRPTKFCSLETIVSRI